MLLTCILASCVAASDMALLAEEMCACRAKLLSGGLSGNNATTIITHLWSRQPVLIPYPTHISTCIHTHTQENLNFKMWLLLL